MKDQNPAETVAPRRVAIVALGPSSADYIQAMDRLGDRKARYDETWTFNTYSSVIQADRIFHMDDFKVQELRAKTSPRIKNMLEALKAVKVPIYTSFASLDYPTSVAYPLQSVINHFGSMYFTTTPPYALAFAGLIGVKEVSLYGMDYTWPGDAGAETGRACMEYWVGQCQARGMRINVCARSTLLDARHQKPEDMKLYGYDRVKISLVSDETSTRLELKPKELPTAEEIEARYSHFKSGSSISLLPTE